MPQDANQTYWDEYTNLQRVKHSLIREYLNGWFPKLGLWSGNITYLDTHAGRGRHSQGQSGSPLVALETLLNHKFRDRILARSQAKFLFIECSEDNAEVLRQHVTELGVLPPGVRVQISVGDCFEKLEALVDQLESAKQQLAPVFAFVDPYGFKVPGALLARLLGAGRVELFVNVIWRELDMALAQAVVRQAGGMAKSMRVVFGNDQWLSIPRTLDSEQRSDRAIDFLRSAYGAAWVTSIRMLGSNNVTRYVLAHFTNHDEGRDLMKDCMWKICPHGSFYARRSDNPEQTRLIEPEPDLAPLREWLLSKLAQAPARWSELKADLRDELWRSRHLSMVIRETRREGVISANEYVGRFSEKADPLLSLTREG